MLKSKHSAQAFVSFVSRIFYLPAYSHMPLSSEEYALQQKTHEDRMNGMKKKAPTRRGGMKKKALNTSGSEVLESTTGSAQGDAHVPLHKIIEMFPIKKQPTSSASHTDAPKTLSQLDICQRSRDEQNEFRHRYGSDGSVSVVRQKCPKNADPKEKEVELLSPFDSRVHSHPNVTQISVSLKGIPRIVNGYRLLPAHRIIEGPAYLDSMHGGPLRLIIDLGGRVTFSGKQGIRVDLTDSYGTLTANVTEFVECEIPYETGWINGVAYRVGLECPPRGKLLNEYTCVSVILEGVRFHVNSGDAYWVTYAPESDEGTSTSASTPR